MATKPVQTLLLEDDAEDARLLQMLLRQAAPGQFDVATVPRLGEALQRLEQGHFDLVLSDLHVPDSSGLNTLRQLHARAPGVPIVVLSTLADDEVAVQAVHEGAQDFLVKGHVNGELIARALRHALERQKSQPTPANGSGGRKARVLAFLGARGGVGTTTVALNVAASLALKKRTILVELRPCLGSLSRYLRCSPPVADLRSVLGLAPGDVNERELNARLSGTRAGLRILYGPQTSKEGGEIDPGKALVVLEGLARLADYLIIDLPSQPAEASRVAVQRADLTAVVLEREPSCVASGKLAVDLVRSWGAEGARVGAVVVNRVVLGCPPRLSVIRSQLCCEVVGVIPPAADACVRAQRAGLPLVLAEPRQLAAEVFAEIAGRLAVDPVQAARLD
jgi:MinD-like ATPase involved in chromosome partitioning or flagellar assembly/CheY-like chemotaxis protein